MDSIREATENDKYERYVDQVVDIKRPVRRNCQKLEALIEALADEVEEQSGGLAEQEESYHHITSLPDTAEVC